MAKIPLKPISILAVTLILFCSTGFANTGIDPNNSLIDPKVEKTEKDKQVGPGDKIKIDSVKTPEKVIEKTTPTEKNTQQVKKQKSSTLSYNFVFYLMYKFKINEIFNLSRKSDNVLIPDNNTILTKTQKWVMELIHGSDI